MRHSLLALVMLVILTACSPASENPSDVQNVHSASTVASTQTASSTEESIFNYKEKLDVVRLAMALQKSGMQDGQQKEMEWNQRFANAKNNAEIQTIFADQLRFYRQGEHGLQSVQMSSEQGKHIHGQILRGISGLCQVLEKIQSLNLDTPEGIVQINELQPQIQTHATDIMNGMKGWVEMMKTNGFEPDAAKEAEFEQKVQELQEKLNRLD